ncbi:Zinc finger protein [Musa troglodytarum]|uniref:Zinc finger protein n=1 Tax=Musa troglodytarum TaxID=320322 RepID=A0A9E7JGK2_9LILI|nr:Zinc finger protein [Musa troglodytarum]
MSLFASLAAAATERRSSTSRCAHPLQTEFSSARPATAGSCRTKRSEATGPATRSRGSQGTGARNSQGRGSMSAPSAGSSSPSARPWAVTCGDTGRRPTASRRAPSSKRRSRARRRPCGWI